MVNLQTINKILREEGVFSLLTNSIKNLKYRIKFNNRIFLLELLSKIRSKGHDISSSSKGKVNIVICMDVEGPNKYGKNNSWDNIFSDFEMLSKKHSDVKVSFFVADWISGSDHGYLEIGHHKIFDKYKKFKNIYWHYHHPSKNYKKPIIDWYGEKCYEDIINRKIIDRGYFPSLFRAGYTYEGQRARKWLNKWIPLDFSSRAPYTYWEKYYHKHLPWSPFQEGKRTIFRSLDAENLEWSNPFEADSAFATANMGQDVILSFFTHDFKDFVKHIHYIDLIVKRASDLYPMVNYEYTDALVAIRRILKIQKHSHINIRITKSNKYKFLIKTDRPIYQNYPYVVIQKSAQYSHIHSLKKKKDTTWELKLKSDFDKLGVAVSDNLGYSKVKVVNHESFNNKPNNKRE